VFREQDFALPCGQVKRKGDNKERERRGRRTKSFSRTRPGLWLSSTVATARFPTDATACSTVQPFCRSQRRVGSQRAAPRRLHQAQVRASERCPPLRRSFSGGGAAGPGYTRASGGSAPCFECCLGRHELAVASSRPPAHARRHYGAACCLPAPACVRGVRGAGVPLESSARHPAAAAKTHRSSSQSPQGVPPRRKGVAGLTQL
jgi:hypothetical protein